MKNAPEIPLPKPFFKFTVGSQGKVRKPSVNFAVISAVQVLPACLRLSFIINSFQFPVLNIIFKFVIEPLDITVIPIPIKVFTRFSFLELFKYKF